MDVDTMEENLASGEQGRWPEDEPAAAFSAPTRLHLAESPMLEVAQFQRASIIAREVCTPSLAISRIADEARKNWRYSSRHEPGCQSIEAGPRQIDSTVVHGWLTPLWPILSELWKRM
jgi:hypothetical protein